MDKDIVKDSIDNAVNDILYELQEQSGITDGGIEPMLALALDDAIDNLTDAIYKVFKYQVWIKEIDA